jgi:hypothetical protein
MQEYWESTGKFKYADTLQKQLIEEDSLYKRTGIISTYDIAIIDNKPCVFVPSQPNTGIILTGDIKPLTYNEPLVHVMSEQDRATLIMKLGSVIVLGGPIVVGGGSILSGPAIPIAVGAGFGIKWLIEKIKEKIKEKEQSKNGNSGGGGGGNGNEDPEKDPKDKDKKHLKEFPNGKGEDNPKHHQNSKNNISKSPRDIQKALDESIEVPGEKCRVAIEDKKFVILREHEKGKWHGYIIEKYDSLLPAVQKALYKAGIIANIKTGRMAK